MVDIKKTIVRTFLAVSLGSAGVCMAQQAPGQQPPPAEFDRTELSSQAVSIAYGDVWGAVEYFMNERKVKLTWVRDYSNYLPDETLSLNGTRISSQLESIGFWPTEVCGFGTDRICVAGKTSKGKTRIQLWTFDTSEPLPDPYVDTTGRQRYPQVFIPVASKTTIYEGSETGKNLVRVMFRNHGAPDSLFVQFHDNRDLMQLSTITGGWTTVLTVAQESSLGAGHRDRWSAHHALGYMYGFERNGGDLLLLFDSNFDGVLDPADTRHLTRGEWAYGPVDFSDPTGYFEHF